MSSAQRAFTRVMQNASFFAWCARFCALVAIRRAFGLLGFPSRYVGTYFTVKIVTNSEQTNDEYYLLLAMISPNTIKSNHQRCLFTF